MEEFYIGKSKIVAILLGILSFFSGCQQNNTEKSQNYIPEQAIVKSLEFTLLDKKVQPRLFSKDTYIVKNYLVNDLKNFKIGDFNVSIIDSSKVDAALSKKATVFEFNHISILSGGTMDLTYAIKPGLYIKFSFQKKGNQWILTKGQPYYF